MKSGAWVGLGLIVTVGLGACHERSAQAVETKAAPRSPVVRKRPRPVDMGDLARIQERGLLRIAVLPRVPAPVTVNKRVASSDRILAQEFARSLGLGIRLLPVETRDELMDLVEKGQADLAAGNLTITKSRLERLAFSRPTRVVREVLVGRKCGADLPRTPEELSGREVYVWGRSSHAETLRDLVSAGRIPLTVVDQDILHDIQLVDSSLLELCTLKEGRHIGWGLRRSNPELLAVANAYVVAHALKGDRDRRFRGDLAAIRERGVLRVLTRNNSVSYFLHRGVPVGFDYTIAKMLARLRLRPTRHVAPRSKSKSNCGAPRPCKHEEMLALIGEIVCESGKTCSVRG